MTTATAGVPIGTVEPQQPYQFGDITKRVVRAAQKNITGRESTYEFGDFTRWIDSRLKENNRDHAKSVEEPYEFGDVTRELLRRFKEQQSSLQNIHGANAKDEQTSRDAYAALGKADAAGVPVKGVTEKLPVKILLQLLNTGLNGGKNKDGSTNNSNSVLNKILAQALDQRVDTAMSDKSGDLKANKKNSLLKALVDFTGEGTFSVGAVARAVAKFEKSKGTQGSRAAIAIADALAEWDDKQQQGSTSSSTSPMAAKT